MEEDAKKQTQECNSLNTHNKPSFPCRICLQNSTENLISVCSCDGSQKYVHRSCLQERLRTSKRTSCELCFFQFRVDVKKRFKWWQSILPWLTQSEIRYFFTADLILFVFITLLSVVACVLYITSLIETRNKEFDTISDMIWNYGYSVILLVCVILLYAKVVIVLVRPTIIHWYNWWKANVIVTLVIENETDISPERINTTPIIS